MDGHLMGLLILDGLLSVINNSILIQFGMSPTIPGPGGAQVVFPTSFTDTHYTVIGGTTLQAFPQQTPLGFAVFNRTVSGCHLDWMNAGCVAASFFVCIGY